MGQEGLHRRCIPCGAAASPPRARIIFHRRRRCDGPGPPVRRQSSCGTDVRARAGHAPHEGPGRAAAGGIALRARSWPGRTPVDMEEWANAERARGTAGAAGGSHRRGPAGDRLLRPASRSGRSGAAGRLRDVGASRVLPRDRVQRGPHRRDEPGDLRVPGPAGDRRAAVPRHGHPRAVGTGAGDRDRGLRGQRRDRAHRHRGRLHPHPGGVARDSGAQRGTHLQDRRRCGGHALAQSAGGRRLQVQPARRWSGRLRGDRMDPGARQRDHHGRPEGRPQDPLRPGAGGPDDGTVRLPRVLCARSSVGGRSGRRPRRGGAHRRRPPGRRVGRLLGPHRRGAPPRSDGHQPADGSHLAVHDAGLGRQDPDGLLVAVRDGVADRGTRPVRDRDGQRRRCRPARHRHPGRRADEPQPLPRHGDLVPLRHTASSGRPARAWARRWCRRA